MRVFEEEQRFNQVWLIVLILVSVFIPLIIIVITYLKDSNTFTVNELLLTIGSIVLASGVIFVFKLSTRIDEKGIHYKFFPFHWMYKCIQWNDINKAHVRHYDALNEYGGWGLKGGALWNKEKGKAINVSGSIGIQLELKTGKKVLIGTQQEKDAKNVLANYRTKIDHNV
ncbi:hypothetical protein [uncultured Winogradskyella sp.]|uniref:hypothetical protein n=1 Tax=uncultured Winogradskyella sp. TaxID=395353 RepID=UPI0030D9C614|tara:strand:- start:30880 stop:31389 length:510 start_codon:yes stop_codon:yes gene_type:complete